MTRIKTREGLGAGLSRAIQAEVNVILSTASPANTETLHAIRVCGKKLRAYIRLLRKPLGREAFDEADTIFRDMTRPLRRFRDDEVEGETPALLVRPGQDGLSAADTEVLRTRLSARHDRTGLEDILATLRNDVQAERTSLQLTALEIRWPAVADALRRTYRRNLNAYANAVRHPSLDNLHEWRKQAKRLLYQIGLFRRVWPGHLRRLEHKLQALTDDLGHIRDLRALKTRLMDTDALAEQGLTRKAIRLIKCDLVERRHRAMRLAPNIYRKDAAEFVESLHDHWSHWHRGPRKPRHRLTRIEVAAVVRAPAE